MAETFPERLSRMRRRRGMSREVLGDFVGVHRNLIGWYEDGKHMPSVKNLCAMADFFDVSLDYLLCRTDDPRTF